MHDSLLIGYVVATYPEGFSIDVRLEDGSRLSNVQVTVPAGSSDTGIADLADIGMPADESRWELKGNPARYMRAVLAIFRGVPLCIGFLMPQENQISFAQKNRRVMRHASDVYTSIDKDGNTELYHPSGTFLRIGTAAAHEDLTGTDFDKKWAIAKNTDKAVHVQLTVANAGEVMATVNIDPSGNISIQHAGNLTVQTDGNAGVTVGGNATIDVEGTADLTAASLAINCDTTITGNLQVNGDVDATGDVTADGVSLHDHLTTGVTAGAGVSGPPQ